MARAKRPVSPALYRLTVTLEGIEPPIWRRLEVPGQTTLTGLHHVLQTAVGWGEYHLHTFTIDGFAYGPPSLAHEDGHIISEWGFPLHSMVLRAPMEFTYLYDFGDGWQHRLAVEEIAPVSRRRRYSVCLDGRRACPPEDVGGVGGYAEFLEAIADPCHPRHRELLSWVGGAFDPEAFDCRAVNTRLKRLR